MLPQRSGSSMACCRDWALFIEPPQGWSVRGLVSAGGLSIMFSGVSAATIAAAPLGSYFGDLLGWRDVFRMAALLGLLALAGQFFTLPRMAPSGQTRLRTLFDVLMRPRVGLGMLAAALVFTGHFAFFTYIRPFLETVTGVGVTGEADVANFVGNYKREGIPSAASLHRRAALFSLDPHTVSVGARKKKKGARIWTQQLIPSSISRW